MLSVVRAEEGPLVVSRPTTGGEALMSATAKVAMARHEGHDSLLHAALRSKAELEQDMGLHAASLASTREALELAKEMADPLVIAADLRNLSRLLAANGRMGPAVDEARNALAMVTPLGNDTAIASSTLFLVDILHMAGRHVEAQAYAFAAIKRYPEEMYPLQRVRLRIALARSMIARERYADARPFLTAADVDRLRKIDPKAAASALFLKARMFAALGDIRSAALRVDMAVELLGDVRAAGPRAEMLEARYALAKADKRWEEAISMLQALRQLDDSLFKAKDDLDITTMQVAHEIGRTAKANDALRDLNDRHVEIIADLRQRSHLLLIALAVVLLLAVALFTTVRHGLRMQGRLRLKNEVVRQQHDALQAKNMELERRHLRLAESLLHEEAQEAILKEIHHRMKNDLQVVDGLLELECSLHTDAAVQRSFKEARGRLRTMAMVHEHLYRAGGRSNGSLQVHLSELARMQLVKHGVHDRLSVSVVSVEPAFGAETLVPLSLLVNELLTNSIRHAIRGRESGHISVSIQREGDGFLLRFMDDGEGPSTSDRPAFPGLQLIELLAMQLNGRITLQQGRGMVFSMPFNPDVKVARMAS